MENLVQHRIVFVIIQYFKYTKENVSTNQERPLLEPRLLIKRLWYLFK